MGAAPADSVHHQGKPNPATPPAAAAAIMIAAVCTNPAAGTGAFGAGAHLHFQLGWRESGWVAGL